MDNQAYRAILDQMNDGLYYMDVDRKIAYWNTAMEALTGHTAREMIDKSCEQTHFNCVDEAGSNLCDGGCVLEKTLADGKARQEDVYLLHEDGHRIPVIMKTIPVRGAEGKLAGVANMCCDNAQKSVFKHQIAELERQALIDPVTGLGNRRYVSMHLQRKFDELERYGWPFGLLFIDIDKFKLFNDRYGHDVGDAVLRMISRTLLENSRSFDFVGRWGGEELVAVNANVSPDEILSIGEKYCSLVAASGLEHAGEIVTVTVSVGCAIAVKGDTEETLMRRADALMYRSKAKGGNAVTMEGSNE